MENHISEYRLELDTALREIDPRQVEYLADLLFNKHRGKKGKVYTMGNGGSAATASHFANDLTKAAGIPTICISDMTPTTLAYMNDEGMNYMFNNALYDLGVREYDTVIFFSCSGESKNITTAIRWLEKPKTAVAFTGNQENTILEMLKRENTIRAMANRIEIQEDVHLIVCHIIVTMIQELRRQDS